MTNRYLPTALRRALDKTVKGARLIAEEGARDAIRRLGVADSKVPSYLNDDEKELRRRLRAHARALGDAFDKSDEAQETKRLVEAAAYAHWHRMLFARFLAERGLLRNPEFDALVSLEDCRDLAEAEGLTDLWVIAERYAASMLPAVFRIDDPVLSIELDPVQTQKLHRLVTGLDTEAFQAEDSLGWTYQFWRAAEKDAVNKSGVKIGADELPAVTQLFTEPYMVRFLLHNTLGAWWAAKVLAADPTLARTAADENELRAACSLPDYGFDMLRFVREGEDGPWRPAAGTFPGWPQEAKAITMLDPCCGSGHFLTESLAILAALRQAAEILSPADAVAAVLRHNLHGLEIDGRCVQIAAFAVALSAWRIGGWHTLPLPHIAWVGSPPPLAKAEFTGLAEGDAELVSALGALYDLFRRAPSLGSLLDPIGGDLVDPRRVSNIERLLVPIVEKARKAEPDIVEGTIAARGMADAAGLLSRKFTLTVTNPPFQTRQSLDEEIRSNLDSNYKGASADLSAAVMKKFMDKQDNGSSIAFVIPSNLVYQPAYKKLRLNIFKQQALRFICRLGSGAFREISGEVVKVSLVCASRESMPTEFPAIDCADGSVEEKEHKLSEGQVKSVASSTINKLNDYRIVIDDMGKGRQLTNYFLITYQAHPVSQTDPYSCNELKDREPGMARNRVQFQKGYSLTQFMDEYGSEEKCTQALFRWRWPNGFVCPRCEHTGHWRHQSRALYQCRRCRHQDSLTAGTILANTKLPLRTWFLAMYLMTQTKNGISALELSRQLSVSYNTAWKVKHKLMQVMKERDDTRPLGGWVQLDDAYWGGQRRGGKSGRGAPGKTPFVAAVELNREGRPMRMRLSRVGGFRSDEIAAWARCHLEPGTVVVSDALGCFGAVRHARCIHQPFVTGGGPASAQHPALTWVNTILGNIKRSLHGTYHHLSSKHLPRYLAEFSYRFNRRFSLREMFPRLAFVALRTPPMPYRVLKLAENYF